MFRSGGWLVSYQPFTYCAVHPNPMHNLMIRQQRAQEMVMINWTASNRFTFLSLSLHAECIAEHKALQYKKWAETVYNR